MYVVYEFICIMSSNFTQIINMWYIVKKEKTFSVFIFFFVAINIVFMYTDGCKIEKITRWQIHRIEVISYLCWCSFLFNTFALRKANKSICIWAFFRNEQVSNPNTTPFFCPPAYPNIHFCMTYIISYISRIKMRFSSKIYTALFTYS